MIMHLLIIGILGSLALAESMGHITIGSSIVNKRSYLFCVICLIVFGVMMSENFGIDYTEYQREFIRAHTMSSYYILTQWPLVTSRGYYLVVHLLSLVFPSYWIFKGIVFTAEVVIITSVIYSLVSRPLVVLFYFWCLCSSLFFNGVTKQAMAMTIAILAFWVLAKKRAKFIGVLLLIAAIFFHGTAAVCLLYIPLLLMKKRLSSWKLILLFVLAANYIGLVLSYIVPIYRGGNLTSELGQSDGGQNLLLLRFGTFLAFSLYLHLTRCKDEGLLPFSYHAYFAAGCIQIGALYLGVFTRVGYYFTCFFGFIVDEMITQTKISSNKRIVTILSMAGACLIYMMWAVKNPYIVAEFPAN